MMCLGLALHAFDVYLAGQPLLLYKQGLIYSYCRFFSSCNVYTYFRILDTMIPIAPIRYYHVYTLLMKAIL